MGPAAVDGDGRDHDHPGLEAAGGRVETLAGTPLAYGKPGFKNDGFIAWGRRPED